MRNPTDAEMGLIKWNKGEFDQMLRESDHWLISKDKARTIIKDKKNFEAHFARFYRIQHFITKHATRLKKLKYLVVRENGISLTKCLTDVLVRHPYQQFVGANNELIHYVFDLDKVLEAADKEHTEDQRGSKNE